MACLDVKASPSNSLTNQHEYMLQVNDDKKYVDFGYVPCNGHVPCQPAHLSPENVIPMMTMVMVMTAMTVMTVMMKITSPAMATYLVSLLIYLLRT